MISKQEGIGIAFVLLNLFVLYYILVQVYSYLIVMLVLYIGHRFIQAQVEENIEINGQGVLVTGCDTGFGKDLALKLESLGFTVYAGCLLPKGEGAKGLNEKNNGHMHILHLDVTSDGSVADAVQYVKKHSKDKGLWAVVNNAGVQRIGDMELIPIEQIKRVAEVNFYGTVRVAKAFIPMIRKSKGRIVNVSDVKGRLALPGNGSYACTKCAIEAFSDSLRREMYKFDVSVSVIEPGNFGAATSMCGKAMCDIMEKDCKDAWKSLPSEVQSLYGSEYVNTLIQGTRFSGTVGSQTTTACVDAMVDALVNTCPKSRYLVHGGERWFDIWSIMAFLNNYLPDSAMDMLISYLAPSAKLAVEAKP